ncbi:MAG TPA: MT-A70 family methyltransferase [Acidimicrobiales bacterium]|nr:MT-A70 family methyltransferase [Acidimicrobiales bacterium]
MPAGARVRDDQMANPTNPAAAPAPAWNDQPFDLSGLTGAGAKGPFGTVLVDPPWRFANRTGKVAPEHRRLARYRTMTVREIASLPVAGLVAERSHCYLWVPNALLAEGLVVLQDWGFTYKSNLVWHKIRKDGGSDGRGVGFYFRNVTELVLFGTRGGLRTFAPGRRQVNLFASRKREHSRKPDELYPIIEQCSPGPYLELFARHRRPRWLAWGDEAPPSGHHAPPGVEVGTVGGGTLSPGA